MKKILAMVGLTALVACTVFGANDGGTVSPFDFGAGARELSLGSASWTSPADAVAAYWNPGHLARTERIAVTGFYTRLFDSDVAYQYAGLALPTLDWGTFGIGVFRLGVDGIEKRDESNLLLGQTSDNRTAIYLAYGRQLSGFDVGLSLQMEQHSLDGYSTTSSPGLSLAANRAISLGEERFKEITFAVVLRNVIQQGMKLDQEQVHFPTEVALGAAATLRPNPSWDQEATLFAGLNKTDQVSSRLSLGLEYAMMDMLTLRGGIDDNKLAVGAGINYHAFSFDYSLVERDLGSIHMFSLTSDFGAPASVRREARAEKREQEFNRLMNDRLVDRNKRMIDDLVAGGKQMLDQGDLTGAQSSFDRALFLSRGINADTTSIYTLSAECRQRLEDVVSKQRYMNAVDSAQSRLALGDYLGVRYYANRALSEQPNSQEASSLLSEANESIQKSLSREETINVRLWQADSLLSYGKLDEASSVVAALREFAPKDQGVILAARKIRFEKLRQAATEEFNRGYLSAALSETDSALALLPGHTYCLNLRQQIVAAMNKQQEPIHAAEATTPEQQKTLSPEMAKEVEADYQTAQGLFKNGDLRQAIQYWEKVELLAPNYQSVRTYLVNAYKYVGVELYGKNELKEAIEIWKKAAKLQPGNKEIADYIRRTENEISKMQELSYGFEQ